MQARSRTTRRRSPRAVRPGAGPRAGAWPALVLAIGLLSQAWLAVVHAGSHAPGPSRTAAVLADHHDGAPANSGDRHDEHRPGQPDEACRVCAAIAVGKLGWASPAPALVAEMAAAPSGAGVARAERAIERDLTTAAPRGPPGAI